MVGAVALFCLVRLYQCVGDAFCAVMGLQFWLVASHGATDAILISGWFKYVAVHLSTARVGAEKIMRLLG